jgi:hypothetical protein
VVYRRPFVLRHGALCSSAFKSLFWDELILNKNGRGGTVMLQEKIGIIGAGRSARRSCAGVLAPVW